MSFDLDTEVMHAKARLAYALDANVKYELKKMREWYEEERSKKEEKTILRDEFWQYREQNNAYGSSGLYQLQYLAAQQNMENPPFWYQHSHLNALAGRNWFN